MRVRFLETYTVKDDEGTTFQKDKTYDMKPPSARHFINKRVAVEVSSAQPIVPETASVEPAETAVRRRGRPRTATSG